jgi:hypothetical protein
MRAAERARRKGREILEDCVAIDHVRCEDRGNPCHGWIHTHGLATLGKPELEVRGCPDMLSQYAVALLMSTARQVARGLDALRPGFSFFSVLVSNLCTFSVHITESVPIPGEEDHFRDARWLLGDHPSGRPGVGPGDSFDDVKFLCPTATLQRTHGMTAHGLPEIEVASPSLLFVPAAQSVLMLTVSGALRGGLPVREGQRFRIGGDQMSSPIEMVRAPEQPGDGSVLLRLVDPTG